MIEKIINYFFQNLFVSYWGAVLFLAYGLLISKLTLKDKKSTLRQNILGISSGIGAILLSILIFVFKLLGKI